MNKDPLVVKQNNYTSKIVNGYIVYDLDTWPNNLLKKFLLKNCLFSTTTTTKSNDKEKRVHRGYGIAFHGKGK